MSTLGIVEIQGHDALQILEILFDQVGLGHGYIRSRDFPIGAFFLAFPMLST